MLNHKYCEALWRFPKFDSSKVVLLLWIRFVIVFCVCLSCCLVCSLRLMVTCWDRAEFLALLYVVFSCVFVTVP